MEHNYILPQCAMIERHIRASQWRGTGRATNSNNNNSNKQLTHEDAEICGDGWPSRITVYHLSVYHIGGLIIYFVPVSITCTPSENTPPPPLHPLHPSDCCWTRRLVRRAGRGTDGGRIGRRPPRPHSAGPSPGPTPADCSGGPTGIMPVYG